MPLGSTIHIGQSYRPSPALLFILISGLHKLHYPWSCSKSLLGKLCNRFVLMFDFLYAIASKFEDGVLRTQRRNYFCHVPYIRNT